jgi:hypothetical protein
MNGQRQELRSQPHYLVATPRIIHYKQTIKFPLTFAFTSIFCRLCPFFPVKMIAFGAPCFVRYWHHLLSHQGSKSRTMMMMADDVVFVLPL